MCAVKIYIFLSVFQSIVKTKAALDPCDPNVYTTSLTHLDVRNPNNIIGALDSGICDKYISEQWYRVDSYDMTSRAPEAFGCGTSFPIWMNDTMPTSGNTTDVLMCIRRYGDPCHSPFNIRVKNCGSFLTYFLIPPSICDTAYCFEWNKDCVNNTVDIGNVEFNGFQWTDTIKTSDWTEYDSALRFLCNFTPLADENLFYRIVWYLDDIEVDLDQVVNKYTKSNATITAYDILDFGKKMGTMIQCRVGAMLTEDGRGCFTTDSSRFFAGIQVLTPQIRVSASTGAVIKLRANIPFADSFDNYQNMIGPPKELSIKLSKTTDTDVKCQGISTNYNKCEKKIPSQPFNDRFENNGKHPNWNEVIDFDVFVKGTTQTDIPSSQVTLRLTTGGIQGRGSKFYDDVFLQDVIVQGIDDNVHALPSCSSLTDPHFKSFDGAYFENQIVGTFILYKNEHSNQEVQVIQELCYSSYTPYCNCAVAVRAGRDIFVVDVCEGIDKKMIDFILCEDRILDPVQVNEKMYNIRMPSGTTVNVVIREWPTATQRWHLDLTVTPSLSDRHNTSGLCGIFDEDRTNDFTRSTGEKDYVNAQQSYFANYPYDFIKSWSFTYNLPGQSLFTQDPALIQSLPSINETSVLLCTCNDDGTTDCSYDNSVRCTNINRPKLTCRLSQANSHLRKTRYARSVEKMPRDATHTAIKRQTSFITTQSDAERICFDAFSKSSVYQICQDKVKEFTNTSLTNCVMDVMLTGDENLTRLHIDASNQECSIVTSQNVTFQISNPDVVSELEMICLNNCSGRGICIQGNCTCDEDFAGTDCSFDKYAPPKLSENIEVVMCDVSTEDCGFRDVHGEYFFLNSKSYCYINRTDILTNSSTVQDFMKSNLMVRTLFDGECPILQSHEEETFASHFTFAITNDEIRFTEKMSMYTYQSHCQDFQNNSGVIIFTLKNNFCFINRACVVEGAKATNDSCLSCDTSINPYQWTPSSPCVLITKDEPSNKDKDSKLGIIIGVSVAAAVIFVILVVFIQKYIQRKGKASKRRVGVSNTANESKVDKIGLK